MSSLKKSEECLKKYQELKVLCEKYDNGTEQFSQIVLDFVELDTDHRRQICNGFGFSLSVLDRWISNTGHPHLLLRPEVIEFILRRVNRKIRLLHNVIAMLKKKGEQNG